jgi:hypothetical protein
MAQKLITPSVEQDLQPFQFQGINAPDGSLKVFMATTQVEALKQLEEYQKTLSTTKEEN